MTIKTTLNLRYAQVNKIIQLSEKLDCSKSCIINSLFRKIFKINSFKIRFLHSVQYQERIKDIDSWKHFHISLEGDVYEKCHDMRKLFKLSVSLIISYAIDKYLEELINELFEGKAGDNYSSNYILFYTKSDYLTYITLVWGMLEEKDLSKVYNLHSKI